MSSNRPDPDSNYLSKYLVDFNKRELEKFFHPEKYPKVVLSAAALGVMAFLFIAWMFPLKDTLLNRNYQKAPVSADQEKEVQNLSVTGVQQVKVGEKFMAIVALRSDKTAGTDLLIDLSYPEEYLHFVSSKLLDMTHTNSEAIKTRDGQLIFKLIFPNSLQTSGTYQELMSLTFIAKKAGRANLILNDQNSIFKNGERRINLWKNNYSVLITK